MGGVDTIRSFLKPVSARVFAEFLALIGYKNLIGLVFNVLVPSVRRFG